jgi:tRNA-Thr(GGU) m(6)t(6)A37 methyltransferase TsaA
VPDDHYTLHPVGHVESPLTDRDSAPRQGDEGGPDAYLVLDPSLEPAYRDLTPGTDILLLTWLHQADRSTLITHPRNDPTRPETGIFTTRSPDRPNPIGLHRVTIRSIDGTRIHVTNLEALDCTPIVDIKPILGDVADR